MSLTDRFGSLGGRVTGPADDTFALFPTKEGGATAVLKQLDFDFYESRHPEGWDGSGVGPVDAKHSDATPSGAPKGGWDAQCNGPIPTELINLDLLVFYTPEAANQGGIEAAISNAVDDTNTVMANSGISNVRFNLIATELAPEGRDESGVPTPTLVDHRDWLSGAVVDGNGNLTGVNPRPSVVARRDANFADLVTMVVSDGQQVCGVTRTQRIVTNSTYNYEPSPAFEVLAYSVVELDCAIGFLDFAHELVHLLGGEHDPQNSATVNNTILTPACPFAFANRVGTGFANTNQRFRTLLAGAGAVESTSNIGPARCPNNDPNTCPGLEYLSHDGLEYAGPCSGPGSTNCGVNPSGTVSGAYALGWLVPPSSAPIFATMATFVIEPCSAKGCGNCDRLSG